MADHKDPLDILEEGLVPCREVLREPYRSQLTEDEAGLAGMTLIAIGLKRARYSWRDIAKDTDFYTDEIKRLRSERQAEQAAGLGWQRAHDAVMESSGAEIKTLRSELQAE